MGQIDFSEGQALLSTPSSLEKGPRRERKGRSALVFKLSVAFLAVALTGGLLTLAWSNRRVASKIDYVKESLADYAIGLFGETSSFECSNHGVLLSTGECLCDLGFAGSTCSEQAKAQPVNRKSVCLVADEFGFLGDSVDGRGHSQAEFAISLSRRGYEVTVLYVGTESEQFSQLAGKFASKNVNIIQLPSSGVAFGETNIQTRSYDVYQFLLRNRQFGHVIFTANSGTAYFTLQAQKQGLLCSETRFTVTMDGLSKGVQERVESGDSDYQPVNINTLKSDFLAQKSIEMADTVVFSSSLLIDEARAEGWNLEKIDSHVIPSLPPQWKLPEQYASAQQHVKEIVFVGPLTLAGGLKTFCDAIDLMSIQLVAENVKVTFMGFSSTILDMTSEEYIELRATAWESNDLQWSIQNTDSLKSILTYMTSSLDKLAVIPSEFDAYAGIPQMLYYSGVPFIGSSMSAIKEIIDVADHSRMISNPDGVELSMKIQKAIDGASVISRPRFEPKSSFMEWAQLLERDAKKTCVSKYDDLEEKPLVSIVIVHHNRHKFLKQTIESINAQTYKNIEVVLVDDGSTDAASLKYLGELSWQWWEEKGWKIIREPNRYLGAARNTGVRNAAGKFILFLDDDDYSKPHHVETLVKVAINTGAEVISAGHDTFSGLRRPTAGKSSQRYIPLGKAKLVGMLENVFGDSSMMVKKEYFVASGGFTEDYGVGFEDYEYYAKVALANNTLEAVPESLHWYRRHSQSMSTKTNLKANQLRMLRPYLAARSTSSAQERAVLEHTQTLFFERFGITSAEERALFREAQTNSTTAPPTLPKPKPAPVKINCTAYLDTTGASAFQFSSVKVWNNKKASWCWDFGTRSTLSDKKDSAALIIPMLAPYYPNGTSAGFPVIASIPCQPGYSDAFAIIQVIVSPKVEFNFFKDYTSLFFGSPNNLFYQSDSFYNFPVVPPGSIVNNLSPKSDLPIPLQRQGWYEKKPIYYFDLGKIPNLPITAGSALTTVAVDILKNGAPFGAPVLQSGADKASGFYASKFFDVTSLKNYAEDDFKSFEQLSSPFQPYDQSKIWNCPIVFTELAASAEVEVFRLDGLEPAVIPNLPSVKVILSGSGFNSSQTVYVNQVPVPVANVTVLSSSSIAIDIDASAFPGTSGIVSVYIDNSISYNLRYYNSKAQITSVDGPQFFTDAENQIVNVHGQYLADFPEAVCVFNVTAEGVSTPLTVENSTFASCPLPAVEDADYYTVNILLSKPKFDVPSNKFSIPNFSSDLNREDLFVPLASNVSNSFMVLAPAPKVVFAQFVESGGSIYVALDNPATVIDYQAYQKSKTVTPRDTEDPFPCSWIFDTNPIGGNVVPGKLARDGIDSDCTVTMLSSSELVLELSAEFTSQDKGAVAPLRRIYIRAGALWYEDAAFSETAASFVTVQAPDVIEVPNVDINAPLYVSSCSDLTLDLSDTTGDLGRLFSSGSISFSTPTAVPTAQSSSLNNTLQAGLLDILSGNATTIVIPASQLWLPSGSSSLTYAFTVKLVNFMNRASTATVLVNRLGDDSAPYTIVNTPNGNPSAGDAIRIVASTKTICNIRDAVAYRWSVVNCPGLTISSSFANAELYIAPYTIPPQTKCDLQVETKYAKDSAWKATPVTFTTAVDVLSVSGGASRYVKGDQDIFIDAVITDDSYNNEPSGLQCSWLCVTSEGICSSSLSARLSSCHQNFIPKGTLSAQAYNFTVTVTNPATGASASSQGGTVITVVNNQVPSVTIQPSEVYPSANSESFALEAKVDSGSVLSTQSLVYRWSNCAKAKGAKVDFNKTSNFAVDINRRDLRTLKFSAGALNPKSKYCVSVAVTDGTSSSGYSEFRFTTRSAPEAGSCELKSGSKYRCYGFTTDAASFPLYYTFYIRSSGDQPWTIAQTKSTLPVFDASTLGSQYQIRAEVSDAAGSLGQWKKVDSLSGSVQRRQSTSFADITTNYQQTKNIQDAEKGLAIASLSIKANDANFAPAVSFVSTLAYDVTVDTQVHGPVLVNILSNIVGSSYNVAKSDWNNVIAVAKQLITAIKTNGKTEAPSNCVGSASITQLLSVADQIFGSAVLSSASEADRKDLLVKISDLIGQVETCAARKKAAQENPLTFSARFLGRKVGVTFTDISSTFCGSSLSANQVDTASRIATYGCGNFDARVFPNNTAVTEFNAILTDVSLYDKAQETSVGLKSTGFIVSSVPLESSFDLKFKISTYVIPDPENANALDYNKNKYSEHSFRPACSLYDSKSQQWNVDVCVPQAVGNNAVACKCSQIATIGLAAKSIPGPSDGSGGSSNVAAIAGGTVAAFVLIAAIAGLVWYLRKRSTQKKKETPLPKSTTAKSAKNETTQAAAIVASNRISTKEKADITSRGSDTTPGRTAEDLQIVVDGVKVTVPAQSVRQSTAKPRVLPAYVRPPTYEEHVSRRYSRASRSGR
ncbi:hypothetical protein HDU97_004965 [Phlyctochytrium planicorne]|nr:hypothetical protein HDU97_004965 [Phlyctochytrium planicorne]